jgi:hypothetical protein
MPIAIPIGTEIIVEIIIKIKVPTIALEIPPPVSPTGFGRLNKKLKFIDEIPSLVIKNKIIINGTAEANAKTMINALKI